MDGKLAPIEALEDDIEAAEEGMLRDVSSFRLENLVHLRRALLTLRKSLFHEREVLVKICRRDSPFIAEAAIYHFRDIYDHLAKFFELVEMNRDILTSLMEMYLSLVNNRMARGRQPDEPDRPPAHPHHHDLHAPDAARRDRRHVRVEHDDGAPQLEDLLPPLPPGHGGRRGGELLPPEAGRTKARRPPRGPVLSACLAARHRGVLARESRAEIRRFLARHPTK